MGRVDDDHLRQVGKKPAQFSRRSAGQEPTSEDEHERVGDSLDLVKHMAGVQQALAAASPFQKHFGDFKSTDRIQAVERFVED